METAERGKGWRTSLPEAGWRLQREERDGADCCLRRDWICDLSMMDLAPSPLGPSTPSDGVNTSVMPRPRDTHQSCGDNGDNGDLS